MAARTIRSRGSAPRMQCSQHRRKPTWEAEVDQRILLYGAVHADFVREFHSSVTNYECAQAASPNTPTGNTGCLNLAPFNVGRNSITGPHFVNLDFSVHKTFPITRISEAFNIQFRAEFFDIANHANFVPPQPNSGDGNVWNSQPGWLRSQTPQSSGFINCNISERSTTFEGDLQLALKVNW